MFNHLRIQPRVALALLVARALVAHGTKRKRKLPGYRVERGLSERDADHAARLRSSRRSLAAADATACRARKAPETPSHRILGLDRLENQVPAMRGNRARDRHETLPAEKIVAEGLLARARNPRLQPIGVWHVVGFDDVNLGKIGESSPP